MMVFAFSHTLLGYVLAVFLLVHVYLGTTGHTVLELLRGMATGWLPLDPDAESTVSGRPERAEDDAA
jgi:thiosulfate reductase cytochrome b subunit